MRDVLDCGVLLAPGHEKTMGAWVTGHQAVLTRVRLHPVPLPSVPPRSVSPRTAPPDTVPPHTVPPGVRPDDDGGADAAPAPDALARIALSLRRFDGCILPVAPCSLAWARMALQQARDALTTPILLLIHDVKAPAILDLLSLGAADFIGQPVCLESMRVRLARLARPGAARPGSVAGGVHERQVSYLGAPPEADRAMPALAPAHAMRAGRAAGAVPTPWAAAPHARPRVPADIVEQALNTMRHQYRRSAPETFRAAKAQVVNGFEREYIRHALSRHGGNVAQAARACAKHRRAFWALMRKHGIDAAPYRQAALAVGRVSMED